jgi:hypothetical protein
VAKPKEAPVRSGRSAAELEPLIRGCKTEEQLKVLWSALTPDERLGVAKIKDEVKAAL